ncbi:DUF3105 domain-containing protein [Streptomyces sp. Ru72]|uniref:DUF3105 domain-containing protein n=1 Tax=Streptomyces sp. Ru72 TaxID=2080747 RepID=UPI000CDDBE03|nr:DUF3105 domain-containing protein [Streptomyces sp. Ru72]POX46316.1 hypothetical protein C3488_26975 [Streptomyces sp. Ru72]
MGSAPTPGSAERKARMEQMRRAERARERRNRILTIAASVVVVAGLVVGGVVLVDSQSGSRASAASGSKGSASGSKGPAKSSKDTGHFVTGKDGVRIWTGRLSRNHVTTSVPYPMHPPVGGDHNPVWLNCNGDVYTEPVRDENAVHSLEHGAVWVTYSGKASKADVTALAAKVRKTPYTLMSPYENQASPIMLTAWGHQLSVNSADDPGVDKFLATYVQGEQTPEPGASCTGGTMR